LKQKAVETTDIFRGAFFLSTGGILEGAYVSQDNRRVVSFKITGENLFDLDQAYRTGKALVNPLQLKESLNLLRETLYRTLKNNPVCVPHPGRKNRRNKNEYHQRTNRVCQTGQ